MPKHAAVRGPKPLKDRQRYRPPNRALSPDSIVNLRNEIRCKNLIHRLQDFALDDPDNPTSLRMTRTQAQVALSLLKKALPDMQTLEISGNQDQPITIQVLHFADPLDEEPGNEGFAPPVARPREPLTIDLQPEPMGPIEAEPDERLDPKSLNTLGSMPDLPEPKSKYASVHRYKSRPIGMGAAGLSPRARRRKAPAVGNPSVGRSVGRGSRSKPKA